MTAPAVAAFGVYTFIVVALNSRFLVAILAYLPAVLFFLVVLGVLWHRTGERAALVGIAATLTTLIASGIQQMDVSIPGICHANNVLYHLLEAASFLLLFAAASWISSRPSVPVRAPQDQRV